MPILVNFYYKGSFSCKILIDFVLFKLHAPHVIYSVGRGNTLLCIAFYQSSIMDILKLLITVLLKELTCVQTQFPDIMEGRAFSHVDNQYIKYSLCGFLEWTLRFKLSSWTLNKIESSFNFFQGCSFLAVCIRSII